MLTTRDQSVQMKSQKLSSNCSREEFEEAWEFLKKVKQIDEESINNRGIFLRYTKLMKLFRSGSLNEADARRKVTMLFKNSDVLLHDFRRFFKNNDAAYLLNRKQVHEFCKMLSRELKVSVTQAFSRFWEHENVEILMEQVNLILSDYPLLRQEFKTIFIYNGILREINAEEEDEFFEADMYMEALESTIRFCEEGGDGEKPPVGIYGALSRFYQQRRKPFKRESLKTNPKLAIQSILPALKKKYLALKEQKKYRHDRCT